MFMLLCGPGPHPSVLPLYYLQLLSLEYYNKLKTRDLPFTQHAQVKDQLILQEPLHCSWNSFLKYCVCKMEKLTDWLPQEDHLLRGMLP